MKNLVVEKKLEVWNEVVERANSDLERILGICWLKNTGYEMGDNSVE